MQGRNRDADTENRLVDTVREGEGGTNWESTMEMYTLSYVKQIASGKLPYNTGSSNQRYLEDCDGVGVGGVQEGTYI